MAPPAEDRVKGSPGMMSQNPKMGLEAPPSTPGQSDSSLGVGLQLVAALPGCTLVEPD